MLRIANLGQSATGLIILVALVAGRESCVGGGETMVNGG
jgi:hypothetical protein